MTASDSRAPASLRRSAELIVAHWREHGAADPEWPADLVFALASELLLALDSDSRADFDLVSMNEIAEMLAVEPSTVRSYRKRGYLPEPFVVLGCGPIWERSTIDHWNRFDRPKARAR